MDVGLVGAAIDIADAFEFVADAVGLGQHLRSIVVARATDMDGTGLTGSHITAAIDLANLHGARIVSALCLLLDIDVDGAGDGTRGVVAAEHLTNGTAIDVEIDVAVHVGRRNGAVAAAEDGADDVTAIDVDIRAVDVGSISAAIDIFDAVVTVVDFHDRRASVGSLVTAAIDSVQRIFTAVGRCVGAVDIYIHR